MTWLLIWRTLSETAKDSEIWVSSIIRTNISRISTIQIIGERGNYNYLLKCTDGIFSGKFLFINTTPDGELFGSGDPDKIDLTMYIESADLSEKHAEIKFVDNCKYVLRDCGSESGTWVRVKEIDLY